MILDSNTITVEVVKTGEAWHSRYLKAFYDIGRAPADHSNRRSTPKNYAVWEIHPVMKMEMVP